MGALSRTWKLNRLDWKVKWPFFHQVRPPSKIQLLSKLIFTYVCLLVIMVAVIGRTPHSDKSQFKYSLYAHSEMGSKSCISLTEGRFSYKY